VHEYRVTKYNPAFRDSKGAYAKDEWTSFKDVGQSFAGIVLAREEYERTEQAYVSTALTFLREAGLTTLNIEGLENSQANRLAYQEATVLSIEQAADVITRVLREEFWCRLQNAHGFVHIGWDYYMYIGVPRLCPSAEARANELGLYVEEFASPYRE
jgi:hypothetical protein